MNDMGLFKFFYAQGMFLLCLLYAEQGYSQQTISGMVTDEYNEPLAFVTILINNDPTMGLTTGIDGRFQFENREAISSLLFSYVGYRTLEFPLSENSTKPLHIRMELAVVGIAPVVIVAGENPAHRIIRKAVTKRHQHNPDKRKGYRCNTYNKMVFDWVPDREALASLKLDSLTQKGGKGLLRKYYQRRLQRINEIENASQHYYLFLMESITKRNFKAPKEIREEVIHNRVSGFKHPSFAALANAIQPFSFYKEHLEILDKAYLNPISPNSTSAYYFSIQDTLYDGRDSIYIIHFEARKGKNFDALKGLLYIHTNGYAIQNVIAQPQDPAFIDLNIEQQYQLIDQENWFPEQLNFELIAIDYPDKLMGMKVSGKSYISEVDLNPTWQSSDFGADTWVLAEDAHEYPDSLWLNSRPLSLTAKEQHTYKAVDSIGEVKHFDRLLKVTEALITGKWPIGKTDLLLGHILRFNEYENIRLGLGFQTNDRFSKWFSMSAYGGYGFEDASWKYGGAMTISLAPEDRLKLRYQYAHDLGEPAALFPFSNNIFNNSFYADRMSRLQEQQLALNGSRWAFLSFDLSLKHSEWEPGFNYSYNGSQESELTFSFTEVSLYMRYAFGEQTIKVFGSRLTEQSHYPVLEFVFSRGIKDWLGGDFNFNRISAAMTHSFLLRRVGKLSYRLEGGIVDGEVPYNHLFVSNTVTNNTWFMLINNTFQTLRPYEFVSDRFAHLFLRYDMSGPLIKTKYCRPRISLLHNMGYGHLDRTEDHEGILIQTMEQGHFESGLRIGDILRIPYFKVAYIGLGAGVYYRYGAYALTGFENNMSYNMTLDFSF